MSFKWVADHFDHLQFAFLGLVLLFAWTNLRAKQEHTGFKKREADRSDLDQLKKIPLKTKATPLRTLPGINLTGEPHEILGIEIQADEPEIMRAYKEKIKLFHPDRIQGQAREQLQFYEDASAKINQAKESMIAHLKK